LAIIESRHNAGFDLRGKATVKFIYDTENGETSQKDPYYGSEIDKIWLIKKFQFYA